MDIKGRTAVVTGGGGGIGGAIARGLAERGAKVLVTDLDEASAEAVRAEIERRNPGVALAAGLDATSETDLANVLARAERELGPVDIFFANAGVAGKGGISIDEDWALTIDVNLMAHVRAARLLLPAWLERGEGYFVATASAAGLLSQIGTAPYAVTKHAAVGFAEWLSITYGDRGIGVSCLCPMGVDTGMFNPSLEAEGDEGLAHRVIASAGGVIPPDDVAPVVLEAVESGRFLALPHPEVLEFFGRKGSDYERWLRGMRRLQANSQDV